MENEKEKVYWIYRIHKDSEWYEWRDKLLGMRGTFERDESVPKRFVLLYRTGWFTPADERAVRVLGSTTPIYMYAVQLRETKSDE